MNTLEAQKILLNQLRLNTKIVFSVSLPEEAFTTKITRLLYKAIKHCVVDLNIEPNIQEVLGVDPELSPAMVSEIYDEYISTANWEYYRDIIHEAYKKSSVERILKTTLAELPEKSSSEAVGEIESKIVELYQNIDQSSVRKIGDALPEFTEKLEDRYKNGGALVGQETPWNELNDYTMGLESSMYYVIGARPSDGKTAVLINMMSHLAFSKVPTGFISAESSEQEIVRRIVACQGPIELGRLKSGLIAPKDFDRLTLVSQKIYDAPLYICDKPGIKLSELVMTARRMQIVYGIKALFVDYIQLIDSELKTQYNRDKVSHVSITLKNLARQLKIPVIAAAQLGRDAENKRPSKADLKESGQIEQDADFIMFIYHERDKENAITQSWFLIEKQRDGETGNMPVYFNKPYVRFQPGTRDKGEQYA